MFFLAVPSYGAMALKRVYPHWSDGTFPLAVPSYGAMALKPQSTRWTRKESASLAVPSYGAMALKLSMS